MKISTTSRGNAESAIVKIICFLAKHSLLAAV